MTRALNKQRREFVEHLIELGNQTQAYKLAYPNCKSERAAAVCASHLLTIPNVIAYRDELFKKIEDASIAKPIEVMQYFTKVMRGEIKDQFDLEPTVQDRTEAAKQLAKRHGLDKADVKKRDINIPINIVCDDDEEEPGGEDE